MHRIFFSLILLFASPLLLGGDEVWQNLFEEKLREAILGNSHAQYDVGTLYQNGRGTAPNLDKAVSWYKLAAAQQNSKAVKRLKLIAADKVRFRNTRAKANNGDAVGQYRLGKMYTLGTGVTIDPALALEEYTKSARQGFSEAEYKLGLIYYEGTGVKPDKQQAYTWFQVVANKGRPAAQYYLGRMLAAGEGVQRNDTESLRWLNKAAAGGYEQARIEIRKITGRKTSANPARRPRLELTGVPVTMEEPRLEIEREAAADQDTTPSPIEMEDAERLAAEEARRESAAVASAIAEKEAIARLEAELTTIKVKEAIENPAAVNDLRVVEQNAAERSEPFTPEEALRESERVSRLIKDREEQARREAELTAMRAGIKTGENVPTAGAPVPKAGGDTVNVEKNTVNAPSETTWGRIRVPSRWMLKSRTRQAIEKAPLVHRRSAAVPVKTGNIRAPSGNVESLTPERTRQDSERVNRLIEKREEIARKEAELTLLKARYRIAQEARKEAARKPMGAAGELPARRGKAPVANSDAFQFTEPDKK